MGVTPKLRNLETAKPIMRRHLLAAALLLVPAVLAAAPAQPARHFLFEPQHALQPEEVAALEAEGLTIQRAVGANRYLVRVRDGAEETLAGDLRVRSLLAYDWTRKIAPSAYAEAAKGRAFARVRVMFHDDVAFDEARRAVEAAGGTLEQPFSTTFDVITAVTARVPSSELRTLAGDERVFAVYGRPLQIKTANARAATLSKVTPLFSAPYNLSGDGVVLSEYELATADTTHVQFGGRLIAHFTLTNSTVNQRHATHVAGTIISAGIEDPSGGAGAGPLSKGMAPKATLHEFFTDPDFAVIVDSKDKDLKPLSIAADNNSWDFALAWQDSTSGWVWSGGEDYYGGYDAFYSTPYELVAVKSGSPLFVHAAGNDGGTGNPGPSLGDFSPHRHTDENGSTITNETFCYSKDGSGNDCPAASCSAGISAKTGERHCEVQKHPIYGPYGTVGIEASLKNNLTVGAVDVNGNLASFSGRGPTQDGRVKPELVAKGIDQFSTLPRSYGSSNGTSMSTPVVTGIAGLLTELYRKTFAGATPSAVMLKTLLIAGADDQIVASTLDQPGPDYAYGFGLADAKASADLIIADGGTGQRIRTGTLTNGQSVTFPLTLAAVQNLRVDLGWFDPEILPDPDDRGSPTLINDLDVKVIDPSGGTVLPYLLNKANPSAAATRGVNHVDTTEVVEIKNAAAGKYSVVVSAKTASVHPAQDFVLVANAPLIDAAPACGDAFEPNDSEGSPFRFLLNGQSITARTCSSSDADFYAVNALKAGPISATVTATDTNLRVTLSGAGLAPQLAAIADVPAGTTQTVSATANAAGIYTLKVEPVGTVGANGGYTLRTVVPDSNPPRHRAARH